MRSTVSVIMIVSALVATLPAQTATPKPVRETIAGTTVSFEMVPVPAGTVTIDGTSVELKPFLIGRHEVTWDMYDVFSLGLDVPKGTTETDAVARPSQPYGAPDYGWGHAGYPVISVARQAAEAFTVWLSRKTGQKYRLPTEAEWQHVSNLAAGRDPLTPGRIDSLAWHEGNASAKTHGVGTKSADAFGLFDLFGNAAEWVTPVSGPPDQMPVTRGGSFRDTRESIAKGARAIQDDSWNERDPQLPKSKWWLSDGPFVGFRLVREH